MSQPIRVLLVEDDPDDAEMIVRALRRAGIDLEWQRVDTEAAFLAGLHSLPDLILSDYSMPQFTGPRALELLGESGVDVPFISVSGTIGEEVAVETMQRGAADYVLKGNLTRLGPAVTRALEQRRLRRERRQLEEQFRQSQKMEAIGQLAGGVAHDFNNILTVIQGYATLLEQGAMSGEEVAREITFAVDRGAGLSRQLLTYSRKQVMQPRDLDLNAVVMDMSKMLLRTLGKEQQLHVEVSPNLPLIRADRGMIEQILLNLVINARDAMPNGGRLTVATLARATENPATAQSSNFSVCLRVSDSGCGVPPELHARIFEPFFTTKDSSKGTGLGLATVLGIVKEHGGSIELTSEPGQGTTFQVIFPALKGTRPAPVEKAVEPDVRGGGETILLVEDEPTLRNVVRFALQHFGYRVLEAASGQQAFAAFEENGSRIDLLLTDITIPDVDGKDLAEQLCSRQPGLRVLYTSGYRIKLAGRDPLEQGVARFLPKPFSTQKLARAVYECLHG